MNKKTKTTLSIFLFIGFMIVALLAYNTLTQKGGNNVAENDTGNLKDAPDFTAKNADGDFVTLTSFGNKPAIISFWATWCPNCVESSPAFQSIHEQYGNEINVILINATDGTDETEEKARDYIAQNGYTFNVLYDVNLDAAYAYNLTALPATYFITADGKIAARGMGRISEENLKQGIEFIKK